MNEEAKKHILKHVPCGLYVIGVRDGDGHHAFTGSWLSQCSMKPPRVMLGVRNGSRSLDLMREWKVFSVNLMAKSDKKIVEQFFKHTPASGDRFGELGFTLKKTKTPILDGAISYLECEVVEIIEAGDHHIVLGEVVEAEVRQPDAPLIMSDTPWHYGG